MNTTKFILVASLIFLGLLTSCAPNKSILYLQDGQNLNPNLQSYANKIQPDDNVLITVTADEPTLAAPFNNMYLNDKVTDAQSMSDAMIGYLVDINGEIDFPRIGKIKIGGLTRLEAEAEIKELIKPYINNPGVNLRILNFKVSVLGEVSNPGSQKIDGDRITLLEALSNAGDLSIYGKRDKIMVLREVEGVRSMEQVDIRSTDFINSPYYYLAHNDVVYVAPNRTRVNASVIGPNLTVGLSAITLLISIISLSTR